MLTKSGARAFFLVGTFLCSGAFILLTIDTFKRIPDQTNSSQISPEVAHGKELWESNNCMGCHTLFGEGAYYAPELTKVYSRRGETFIRQMLKDPQSMYPGERKMQKYNLSEDEISALVAFLRWSGEVDLNGFPADPPLKSSASVVVPADEGSQVAAPVAFNQLCLACHQVGGSGGKVGPALDGIGSRQTAEWLTNWIRDPLSVKPGTSMPKLPLSDQELDEIVKYLTSLK